MDFLVVETGYLDFLGLVSESLDQTVQYHRELLHVLVDFVLDLDWGSEFHLRKFQELQMDQTLCQNPQMFVVRDFLLVERDFLLVEGDF